MASTIVPAKSIFLSKTFWGSILALLSVIDPTYYQHLLNSINISDPNLIVAKITGFMGAALAIYGRYVATQVVTIIGKDKVVELPNPTLVTTSVGFVQSQDIKEKMTPIPKAGRWLDLKGK